jgi:hypothetical protein
MDDVTWLPMTCKLRPGPAPKRIAVRRRLKECEALLHDCARQVFGVHNEKG